MIVSECIVVLRMQYHACMHAHTRTPIYCTFIHTHSHTNTHKIYLNVHKHKFLKVIKKKIGWFASGEEEERRELNEMLK